MPSETRHRACTIEQTGHRFMLVAGFPSRDQLTEWHADPDRKVLCLFPANYRDETTQVKLRTALREELDKLGASPAWCQPLVMTDPALGNQLGTFDFDGACTQMIAQLTPRTPRPAAAGAEIPSFG